MNYDIVLERMAESRRTGDRAADLESQVRSILSHITEAACAHPRPREIRVSTSVYSEASRLAGEQYALFARMGVVEELPSGPTLATYLGVPITPDGALTGNQFRIEA